MNAHPYLRAVARALAKERLEAVMIGNAAAALQGAPVTTLDVDFFVRDTPRNRAKIKAVADDLGAQAWQPYYPASKMIQLRSDTLPMPVEFVFVAHGIRSFEGLRTRAVEMTFDNGEWRVLVASLPGIIKRRRSCVAERGRRKERAAELRALRIAAARAEAEMIRRCLAMTPEQRLNFLRVKLPGGGSAL